jgi:hypothetical protein
MARSTEAELYRLLADLSERLASAADGLERENLLVAIVLGERLIAVHRKQPAHEAEVAAELREQLARYRQVLHYLDRPDDQAAITESMRELEARLARAEKGKSG